MSKSHGKKSALKFSILLVLSIVLLSLLGFKASNEQPKEPLEIQSIFD